MLGKFCVVDNRRVFHWEEQDAKQGIPRHCLAPRRKGLYVTQLFVVGVGEGDLLSAVCCVMFCTNNDQISLFVGCKPFV